MVDSAKAADVKIIPYEHTFDGVLESNVEEGTDDHKVKANVGGDRNRALEMHTKPEIEELPVRKKMRAKDTIAGSAYLARIEALTVNDFGLATELAESGWCSRASEAGGRAAREAASFAVNKIGVPNVVILSYNRSVFDFLLKTYWCRLGYQM
ncbi:hypothetical protein C5167_037383 [Papaver somniferum]|uniref:Uncharacterized protein n=1 Tax=Papaver somniferum TaxID=3469 RepID=A0A4Y7I9C7_PAPSO|nr:hypothetical protein C5167_037383 [Papaver somniferum]